ncbi:putative RNA-directed DNA polymerase [Tanacetum coccineum]
MFKIVKRLKALKKPLRKLLYDQGNIHNNVVKLRHELDEAQKTLDSDPSNHELREEEAEKIEWLKLGDANTAYFHKVVKSQASRNRIDSITNSQGLCIDGDQVPLAFVDHYTAFLGQQGTTPLFDMNDLPGPDGYSAAFFKEAWDIVGPDVSKAVKEFFTNGILLKELNHTIIALIPKVTTPMRINDFRPISCCNVLFKCISSIISNRMKGALQDLVSINQSAFVPGRRISDNILLTQELMHNYHLDRGVPRCAFKVDIQKAYDTVDWTFLHAVLVGFRFHPRMIGWIMECVTSTSFSISINGSLHGYFKGKRGLRQGDPMSPYLFTLVMEVLTLMLHRRARATNNFTYHRYCSKLNIMNLCFADDLFLFAHGDVESARVIMDSLQEFKDASGLTPSLPKSTAYFCNVLNYVKIGILNILPFEEGNLPVKYLGVPLVPSRLVYRDCAELMERVKRRICDWKNKFLSFAGRAQLVRSVLSSMHVYWASVFILPSSLIIELEQLMRGFLWCQGEMKRGKAKVAWEVVCLPKKEGGLGIRRLDIFNKALVSSHIWSLLSGKESLWVKWIHVYKLNGRSFWDIPIRGNIVVGLLPVLGVGLWIALDDIVAFLIPVAKMKSIRSVVCKLVFSAACYFLWQERNYRILGPRNQDSRNMNQDNSRRTVNVEETSSKAMVAIDGAGFDWSYMADDEVSTNMALMDFSYSKNRVYKSEFNFATYKRGLASVEEQLVFYKKNQVILYEQLAVLKRDISYKDSKISMLKRFVRYNVVPLPHTRLFSPPNLDLSYSGLEEFQQPEFEGYGPKPNEKKTMFPTVAKIEFVRSKQQENPVRKPVKYVEMYRSQNPRGNQRNWNNQKSQQLGINTARLNSAVVNVVRANQVNAVKASACFKEFDGGYVTFSGGAKKWKITGKGTFKTSKLDFEDAYFVKELQFNLFSVS